MAAVLQFARCRGEVVEAHIHGPGGPEDTPRHHDIAAVGLVQVDALQVDRQALAGLPLLGLCPVGLDSPDTTFAPRGK